MKRFWKDVTVAPHGDDWTITLDGRQVNTPARKPLVVPNEAMAEAIAEEWRAVEDTVDPAAMAFTGLANAAIDRIAQDTTPFVGELVAYAGTDLLCYRAVSPEELVKQQGEVWRPLLAWAQERHGLNFNIVTGIMYAAQPDASLEKVRTLATELSPFQLAAMSRLTTLSGSVIIALALADGAIEPEQAWRASIIDELWQEEHWGADTEALAERDVRERDFLKASDFLRLTMP